MAFSITDSNRLVLIRKFRLLVPSRMRAFPYERNLSWAEYQRAARGVVPLSAEDKWLVLQHGGRLSFYRSGNGVLVYRVRFVNRDGCFRAVRAEVNADETQVQHQPDSYETDLLDYLTDRLLLGLDAEFPSPPGTDPGRARILERIWMGSLAARG